MPNLKRRLHLKQNARLPQVAKTSDHKIRLKLRRRSKKIPTSDSKSKKL